MRRHVPMRSRADAKLGFQGGWIVLDRHVKCGKLQSRHRQNNEPEGIVGADLSFDLL
jgi:hypothetical protein